MRKCYCDKCGKEIAGRTIFPFEYRVHIEDTSLNNCYQDKEGNQISERVVVKELCAKCYNMIMHTAYQVFKAPIDAVITVKIDLSHKVEEFLNEEHNGRKRRGIKL
jgi:hypothetical protein